MRARLALLACLAVWCYAVPARKYSPRVVRSKYGELRGVVVRVAGGGGGGGSGEVEAFLGVPYATPPTGSLRYMPPVTPSTWRGPRLCDASPPPCPQAPPRGGDVLQHPRARLAQLTALQPLLANHSEDCLYLNLYLPWHDGEPDGQGGASEETSGGPGDGGDGAPLPTVVLVHGESFSWGAGSALDGAPLAARAGLVVVTVNFRLGVLGFLKTGSKSSAQGNFGLMDLVAALHWLRESLPAFGGDPHRVTVLGHGTGAALANYLAVSPVASQLIRRVVLLSGSGLSPWALQRDPLMVKRKVAEQTGCHGDLVEEDLAPCLRTRPLSALLAVTLDPPRFTPGFAPFVDGTVITHSNDNLQPAADGESARWGSGSGAAAVVSAPGHELADFPQLDLMFSLATTESYLEFSAQDLEFGFNESRRDRILRTFVRNHYYFHLNEIYSTLRNEYTDWDKPAQSALSIRDATLEVLSDGLWVAGSVRVGWLHAARGSGSGGGRTYAAHFAHASFPHDYPQRPGSVHGEQLPYWLALAHVHSDARAHNRSAAERRVEELCVHFLANFVRYGNPNAKGATPPPPALLGDNPALGPDHTPYWDTYDTVNQLYMEISAAPQMRSHYRGHKMSLWLALLPQLHRAPPSDATMRHHHFADDNPLYYEGSVRPQSMSRAQIPQSVLTATGGGPRRSTVTPARVPVTPPPPPAPSATECPPDATPGGGADDDDALLRRLASSHYQSYTAALTVTIAVGCFLLLLNVVIFAGIYRAGGRAPRAPSGSDSSSDDYDLKRADVRPVHGKGFGFKCKSHGGGSGFDLRALSECGGGGGGGGDGGFGEYRCYEDAARAARRSLPDVSVGGALAASSVVRVATQPPAPPDLQPSTAPRTSTFEPRHVDSATQVSTPLPAPPPPAPPGIMKKRVQIQEISV